MHTRSANAGHVGMVSVRAVMTGSFMRRMSTTSTVIGKRFREVSE